MLMMMMSFLHLMRLGSVRKQFFLSLFHPRLCLYQPSAHHHRMEMKSSEKEWTERWKDLYRFKLAPNSSTDREKICLEIEPFFFLPSQVNLDVGIKIRLKEETVGWMDGSRKIFLFICESKFIILMISRKRENHFIWKLPVISFWDLYISIMSDSLIII